MDENDTYASLKRALAAVASDPHLRALVTSELPNKYYHEYNFPGMGNYDAKELHVGLLHLRSALKALRQRQRADPATFVEVASRKTKQMFADRIDKMVNARIEQRRKTIIDQGKHVRNDPEKDLFLRDIHCEGPPRLEAQNEKAGLCLEAYVSPAWYFTCGMIHKTWTKDQPKNVLLISAARIGKSENFRAVYYMLGRSRVERFESYLALSPYTGHAAIGTNLLKTTMALRDILAGAVLHQFSEMMKDE
ncbi:MAG TPA: hypothetical protein PLD10_13155 [Rhodopila sp.]|nr:hypothetical protein [Rhodopila sp.]